MKISAGLAGMSYLTACSFEVTVNASGGSVTTKAISEGGYEVECTVDLYFQIGLTADSPSAVPLPATQPSVPTSSPMSTAGFSAGRMYAGQRYGFDVPAAGMSVSVIAVGASAGVCTFNGPMTMTSQT